MSTRESKVEPGTILRRSLFVILLVLLTFANLFVLFRGLSAPMAMDQAQIAREISRGNGFTTKFIRPAAYQTASDHQEKTLPFSGFPDTYHSPLNPLINAAVLKLVKGDQAETWNMPKKEMIYPLDRVIATVSTIFFLMSIGVTYLLISRIFDTKIASFTALIMLFSSTFWAFSLSGLPQMLMLLLFSCGLFFAYRAVEESAKGSVPLASVLIAGTFFTLLAMTHFLAIWIALGFIIYVAIAFRPRGILAISITLILFIPAIFVILRNLGFDGTPFGTAFYSLYNGVGNGRENFVLRGLEPASFSVLNRGFIQGLVGSVLVQISNIIPFLASIFIAPLFFLTLLHPFRNPSIAHFRWALLLMFALAVFGLAVFGITTDTLNPNQLLLLFAPIMTAYSLAFVSILWSRIPSISNIDFLKNAHLVVITAIAIAPFLVTLPSSVLAGLHHQGNGGIPQWPPYYPPALSLDINRLVSPNDIIVADQPWAVAWYSDRISIWLPPTKDDFVELEALGDTLDSPFAGILITPISHSGIPLRDAVREYADFDSLIIDGHAFLATFPPGVSLLGADSQISDVMQRYPNRIPLVGMDTVFYSSQQITSNAALRAETSGN